MIKRVISVVAVFALTCSTAWAQLALTHQYLFTNGNANDLVASAGSLNGTAGTSVTFNSTLGAVFSGDWGSGTADAITFTGNDVAATAGTSSGFSVEFWGRFGWHGDGANVFNIGSGTWGNGLTQWAGNGQHVFAQANGSYGSYDNWGVAGLAPLTNWGSGPNIDVVDVFNQNDNSIKIYINGGLYQTGSMSGVSLANINNSVFNIGGAAMQGGDNTINGSITAFRTYATALDPSVIAALDTAGPASVPTVTSLTSTASGAWGAASTWNNPPNTPASTTMTTVANAVTLSAASGNALAATLNAGSLLSLTGGTLNIGGTVISNGGTLALDGASILNLGFLDAANPTGLSTAAGATITVAKALVVDAPLALGAVNFSTNDITVKSGASFSTAGMASFRLTGGAIMVEDVGSNCNFAQGASTASGATVSGGTLNISGAGALAVGSQIDLNGRTSGPSAATLAVAGGTLTCDNIRISHDEGARGRMVVSGNGYFSANYVQQGFNGAINSLIVKDNGQFHSNGNWDINQAHNGHSYISVSGNGAISAAGDVRFGSDNGVANWNPGSTLGSTQYCNVEVSGNASLTIGGQLTMLDTINGGSVGGGFSQVDQTAGKVTVNGGNGIIMSRDYQSGWMQAVYNLGGGTLAAQKISQGTGGGAGGVALVNFHGGTLAYNGAGGQSDFIHFGSSSGAYVYEGGMIDTGGKNVTINQPLLSPNTGSGVSFSTITYPLGSGYTVPPAVVFLGGSGQGATAVATIDAAGEVTGITVTNPGVYTSAPTQVLLNERSNEGTIDITSNLVMTPNAYTGGITKTGLGTLTLNGANTYTGGTTINAGTLVLGPLGSLADGPISVHSGAVFAPQPSPTITAGVANASLSLPAGAGFDMSGDGTTGTFQLNGSGTALTLGGASLGFDVGGTGSDEFVVSGGSATVSGTNVIQIKGLPSLSSLSSSTAYTLITAAGGLDQAGPGAFTLAQSVFAIGSERYTLALQNSPTMEQVVVTPAGPASFTWAGQTGGPDNLWNTAANWNNTPPGYGNVAVFSDSTATLNTVDLGPANVNVAGLTFDGRQSMTITATAPSNPQLILDGTLTGNVAAIAVSGAQSITAPIQLASTGSITTANASDRFTVNSLSDNGGGYPLSINGPGATTFNGSASLGVLIKNDGGTTTFNNNVSLNGSYTGSVSGQAESMEVNAGRVLLNNSQATLANILWMTSGQVILNNTQTNFASGILASGNGTGTGPVSACIIQNGGTVNSGGYVGLGEQASGYATYELHGGTLNINNDNAIGFDAGSALFTIDANSQLNLNNKSFIVLCNGGNCVQSTVVQRGGTVSVNNGENPAPWESTIMVGANSGQGVWNQLAGEVVSPVQGITLCWYSATGIYNLNGGTLLTANVHSGSPFASAAGPLPSYLNFHGGVLMPTADNSNFIFGIVDPGSGTANANGITAATVWKEGAVINTNGHNIGISTGLVAPSGSGVVTIPLTDHGSGYIGTPDIQIAGDGVGATAVANMVSDGVGTNTYHIASITVTNPGTGYTTISSVDIVGGDPATAATLGTATLGANDSSGGLTKLGEGTLTLSGTNTYMGTTTVREGTLILDSSYSILDGTSLTVGDPGAFHAPIVPQAAPAIAPVPEPGTLALLCSAVGIGLGAWYKRWLRARR